MSPSRRPAPTRPPRAIAAAAAALALAFLTGCAGDPSEPGGAGAPQLPAAEGTTEYPMTLDSPFGATTLEERPERVAVVTAATYDSDALFALGVTPVLAPSTLERNAWLDPAAVAGVETLWDAAAGDAVSPEQVAASEPDLIVSLGSYEDFDQAAFDQLSAIAPVLYAPIESLTWQEITREVAGRSTSRLPVTPPSRRPRRPSPRSARRTRSSRGGRPRR